VLSSALSDELVSDVCEVRKSARCNRFATALYHTVGEGAFGVINHADFIHHQGGTVRLCDVIARGVFLLLLTLSDAVPSENTAAHVDSATVFSAELSQ